MIGKLTKGNHNLDWQFSIVFTEKAHEADLRPMLYPGRFVFPLPLGDPKKNPFFGCALRRNGRTPDVRQLNPKDMKEIEDLSPDALPPSMDPRDIHVHGGAKYNQIGTDACSAVIAGVLDGASPGPAVLILDLYPRVGDMMVAFTDQKAQHVATSLFYCGIYETQQEETWATNMCLDTLAEKRLSDDQKDINADLLETLPKLPTFNRMVVQYVDEDKSKTPQLGIPLSIVKTWQMHSAFGSQFGAWLTKFTETYSIIDGTPQKRPLPGGPGSDPPSVKKAKIMQLDNIMEVSNITDALIHECRMAGTKDAPMLQMRGAHMLYIVNQSPTQEWTSCQGFVCGYGKGGFKLVKVDADDSTGVMFTMTGSKDKVVFNGVVQLLGKVVADQREKKPDATVCYHKLEALPEDPKEFSLTPEHKVAFYPADADKDPLITCTNFATKFTKAHWEAPSNSIAALWMVRWSAKGLMPVKPVVHLVGSATLPPGRALKC